MSGVDSFNSLSRAQQIAALLAICSSEQWALAVLNGAPFPDENAAMELADRVLATLTDSELDTALDGHPRIGARPDNPLSAREQAGIEHADATMRAALRAGNQAYETRFGYVYLVCANGRSAGELVLLLNDRLNNDPVTEREIMRAELGKINRLRLRQLLCKA